MANYVDPKPFLLSVRVAVWLLVRLLSRFTMAAASWEIVAATPCRGDMLGPHIRVYKYENHTIKQEARLFVDIAGQILFQSKWTTSTWHGSFREDPTHGMLILRFHYSGDGVQKSAVVSKVGSNKWEGQDGEMRDVTMTFLHTLKFCRRCGCFHRVPDVEDVD